MPIYDSSRQLVLRQLLLCVFLSLTFRVKYRITNACTKIEDVSDKLESIVGLIFLFPEAKCLIVCSNGVGIFAPLGNVSVKRWVHGFDHPAT